MILESGYRGIAKIPSGASVGKYEAVELRDKDIKRFAGMGVLKAVKNINEVLAPKLKGMDALDQGAIDKVMVDLDGTANKASLGANSILAISLATAVAAANHQKLPLYRYIHTLISASHPIPLERIPTPTLNVINGGLHGAGNLNFQEFHIVPASNKSFSEALRIGVEIYHMLKKMLVYRNAIHSVGDEGGFAPDLFKNIDALEIILEAIKATSYRFGVDVFFGLDIAASSFKTDSGYQIKDRPMPYSAADFISYLKTLHSTYKLLILEDPFEEDDWESWKSLTASLGSDVLIVGDDLLVTNPEKLQKAIDMAACSAILLKPNQIGTLSEFLAVVVLAKQHDIKTIVSHRSGETEDTFIADLAVGVQSDYVKFGAPARSERVAKYNRLLEIEKELFPSL